MTLFFLSLILFLIQIYLMFSFGRLNEKFDRILKQVEE